MTERPSYLKVVGSETPEPDDDLETIEMIANITARMAEAAKTDGLFWVLTIVEGETRIAYYGGKLESSALAEELAWETKREAMGIDG